MPTLCCPESTCSAKNQELQVNQEVGSRKAPFLSAATAQLCGARCRNQLRGHHFPRGSTRADTRSLQAKVKHWPAVLKSGEGRYCKKFRSSREPCFFRDCGEVLFLQQPPLKVSQWPSTSKFIICLPSPAAGHWAQGGNLVAPAEVCYYSAIMATSLNLS